METELKLLIAPADIAAFRRLALLGRYATDRPRTRLLRNTYFDTPELLLRAHDMALRVRRSGRTAIQTLKLERRASAGLHQRQEWETPVAGPDPELASLAALVGTGPVAHTVLGAPGLAQALVPIFESVVRRTVWPLRLPEGAEVELALDRGELRHDDARAPIGEVELELKAGEPAALFDFALQLQQAVPLRVGNLGKAARGYALLAPRPVGPVKAMPIALDAEMTVEQGFRVIADNCLAQMQENEPGVVLGTDPECVHQMRIGMRRLRSAQRLFAKWIPLPAPLQDELAWLGGELGAVRDADVLADATLARVTDACPQQAELLSLKQSASTIAIAKRQQAAAAVASVRHSRLMLGLVAWLQAGRWRESLDARALGVLAEPIAWRAARIVARCRRRLREAGRRLDDGTPAERHRVRIAAKKARYATEFFASLSSARRSRRYLGRLVALQDALGALNDAAVADRLLGEIEQSHPEFARSAAFARGYLCAAANEDARRLGGLWKRCGAKERR